MRLDAITLKQLRALLDVAQTGSLTQAASRVGQTVPSIHNQIKNLELAVGVPLLTRATDGSGFHLTPAGAEIDLAAHRVEAVLSQAARQIAAYSQGKSGHVVLGTVSTAEYFAPRLVRLLNDRLPDIEVELRVSNRSETITALDRGEYDLAIMGRPPRQAMAQAVPLGPHPHGIVLRPGHPMAGKDGYDPALLMQETFLSREDGSGTRLLMERFLDRLGEGHDPKRVVLSSNETIKQAVMAGLGIGFLSLHTVENELLTGRLSLLRGPDLPVMRHWYMIPGALSPEARSQATKACAAEIERLAGAYFPRVSG